MKHLVKLVVFQFLWAVLVAPTSTADLKTSMPMLLQPDLGRERIVFVSNGDELIDGSSVRLACGNGRNRSQAA